MASTSLIRKDSCSRLLGLLRRSHHTVNELAHELSLTDNAVRAQLTALQKDGLVEMSGKRRGLRRPSHVYQLTPTAAQLSSRAYAPVLNSVLQVLQDRLPCELQQKSIADTGAHLAQPLANILKDLPLPQRLQRTIRFLASLGADVRVTQEPGVIRIQGNGCPLSLVAREPAHTAGCRIMQAMLQSLLGVPVEEACQRGASPRCCFVIRLPST